MAVSAPDYLYTSQADIERLMSVKSAELYVDDIQVGQQDDPDVWTDVIYQATDIVNMYVQNYYAPEDLVNNSWVHRMTTWLAAHYLTQRRGNPGAYNDLYNEALFWLEKVQTGRYQIPRVPQRAWVVPAVSNYVIDDRFPVNKIRTQPSTMVGPRTAEQDIAPVYFFDTLF
jgi:phage gp36-like protein